MRRQRITVGLVVGAGLLLAALSGRDEDATAADRAMGGSEPVQPAGREAAAGEARVLPAQPQPVLPPADTLVSRHQLTAELVDGSPCPLGQVLVRASLAPEEPDARITIMKSRGNLVALDLPQIRGGVEGGMEVLVPVTAKLDGEIIARTSLPLMLEPCPARLAVGARRVGPTSVRVKVWMFGEADRNATLRYDFGQGHVKETSERDVTFDYGAAAEGERYAISVRTVGEGSGNGAEQGAGAAAPGLAGFAVVIFPDLEGLRATEARLDALQREQNEVARRRGWDER